MENTTSTDDFLNSFKGLSRAHCEARAWIMRISSLRFCLAIWLGVDWVGLGDVTREWVAGSLRFYGCKCFNFGMLYMSCSVLILLGPGFRQWDRATKTLPGRIQFLQDESQALRPPSRFQSSCSDHRQDDELSECFLKSRGLSQSESHFYKNLNLQNFNGMRVKMGEGWFDLVLLKLVQKLRGSRQSPPPGSSRGLWSGVVHIYYG